MDDTELSSSHENCTGVVPNHHDEVYHVSQQVVAHKDITQGCQNKVVVRITPTSPVTHQGNMPKFPQYMTHCNVSRYFFLVFMYGNSSSPIMVMGIVLLFTICDVCGVRQM
jgi:hypothetical protein